MLYNSKFENLYSKLFELRVRVKAIFLEHSVTQSKPF